jgi:hypothetical protein
MSYDVPETEQHRPRGRGWSVALGRRTDNDQGCTLLVVSESDGSWSFHGLGASAGVKLGKADTLALVELILARTDSRDPACDNRCFTARDPDRTPWRYAHPAGPH